MNYYVHPLWLLDLSSLTATLRSKHLPQDAGMFFLEADVDLCFHEVFCSMLLLRTLPRRRPIVQPVPILRPWENVIFQRAGEVSGQGPSLQEMCRLFLSYWRLVGNMGKYYIIYGSYSFIPC